MNEELPVEIKELLEIVIKEPEQKKYILKTRSIFSHIYLTTANNEKQAIESVLGVNKNCQQSLFRHDGESSVSVEQVPFDFTITELSEKFPEYYHV